MQTKQWQPLRPHGESSSPSASLTSVYKLACEGCQDLARLFGRATNLGPRCLSTPDSFVNYLVLQH
eukprot:4517228-Amphidinium_carterae.1